MATARTTAEATLGSLKIPAPKHFNPKGREEDTAEFETFSQQLKAYLSIQTRRFREHMNKAEQHVGPINMPLNDEDKKLAVQLQNFLILMCHGKAAHIVYRDDTDENGFESWRRLHVRYTPSKRVKYLDHMQKILTWKFTEANLEQDLNDWEIEIEKYGTVSSGQNILSDDIKVSILVSKAPSEIQRHFQLTTGPDSTYSQVRGVIINYCKTR